MHQRFLNWILRGEKNLMPMLFLALIFLINGAFAQSSDIKFRHINHLQGLSNSTIESIYQDSRGFIWFGTRDGLNKYDGYQITVYKNIPGKKGSLSDNYVKCIREDAQHNLWIGTSNGLNRFDAAKNEFIRYAANPKNPGSLSGNNITCLYLDKARTFWIGTADAGLNQFLPAKNSFSQCGEKNVSVKTLFEDRKKQLWVGASTGLKLYNREKKNLVPPPFRVDEPVNSIEEDNAGGLWLGLDNAGLIVFNPAKNSTTRFRHQENDAASLSNDQVKCLFKDRSGKIWAGCINGGLNEFLPTQNAFRHYVNKADNPGSLSQRTVSAIYEDRQLNFWVGTHRGGINVYNPQAKKFKLVENIPSKNSLSYNDVRAFFEDKSGSIWIGTDGGGLNRYNPLNGHFDLYRNIPGDKSSLASDAVLDIIQDSTQNLWVSTWGGGLNKKDVKTGRFSRYINSPADANSISSNYVQQCLIDSKNNFWVATYYGGLHLFNPENGSFKRVKLSPDGKTELAGNNIVSLHEDPFQNLWIGTDDGGLNRYNLNTKQFSHYFQNQKKLPDLRILFTDKKSQLWVGQSGLYLFNRKADRFNLFTAKGGLATEFIKGIEEDERQHLWMTTSSKLIDLNPETMAVKIYNSGDGLQDQEFEANASMKTRNGDLCFGGVNGFNHFNPEKIVSNRFVPPVYLTGFQIFNKQIFPDSSGSPLKVDIGTTKEIRLSYKQSTIAFSFVALNYIANENNRYAYKMEGLDSNWYYTGDERKVSFTNLKPGDYTFRVKASNNDGIWNNKGVSVHVIITPPFWETWWFRLLFIAFILYAAYRILRFKKNLDLRKINEQKREEMQQLKLQFFTNISHEFRTPLSLIMGPLENLMSREKKNGSTHEYEMMHRNAHRLMLLINELMDFRKVESGSLKVQVLPGNINLFIEELIEEFKADAERKDIRINARYSPELNLVWFDRQILEKVILNLVNNSLKYTPAGGNITIEILNSLNDFKPSFDNELFVKNDFRGKKYSYIRIADSGIGISKESIKHLFERYYRIAESHLGSGIGLAFVKSLTVLHKGDIYVYSQRHAGTEIIIALPCAEQDYALDEKWKETYEEGGVRLESIVLPALSNDAILPKDAAVKSKGKVDYRLLIVDDNPELRAFLIDCLEDDYTIFEAADGEEGMEAAIENHPDLIVSDVMMPGTNGLDFCRSVKENVETSHIPFLMLTAKTNLQSEIDGFESGADLYLSKPVSPNLLKLSIRNILEQRQRMKERYSKNYDAEIRELVHTAKDREFMEKLIATIEQEMSNPELDIDFLCRAVAMSRTKLYHKIKQVTGQSANEFIRTIRLKKAVEILTHEDVLLTEVMYRVGIQTQSYFTKAFKKEFGKTPSQFVMELQARN